ncbi:MAG: polysaccharide pyruvyl transferase family protein [Mycobacteriaceae bacterium]
MHITADSTKEIIYLIAPAGYPNLGDELVTAAWLRHLRGVRPGALVVLDCHSPGQASVLFAGMHPDLRCVDTLWRVCAEAPSAGPWQVAEHVQRAVHDPGRAPRWVAGLELLASATTVHVLGGGYVNALWPKHLGLLAGAIAAVTRSGGQAVATGLGLLPAVEHSQPLLRTLAAQMAVFDVRDRASAELVGGALCSGDDVWLGWGEYRYDTTSEAADRDVVLCLQSDRIDGAGENGVERLAGYATEMLRQWGVRGDQVAVVEGIPGADRVVFAMIEHLLPGALFVPFADVWKHGLPARAGQRWISTRFHPHLLAAGTGASGIAVSLTPDYYAIKHGSLLAAGSRWHLVTDTTGQQPVPHSGGFSPEDVASHQAAKSAVAATIYPDRTTLATPTDWAEPTLADAAMR